MKRNLQRRVSISLDSGPKLALLFLMPDETRSSVKTFPKEKFRVLAEANGWSLEHARGYVDGEAFRSRGKRPSNYALVGIDEYCLGFRAGYYERVAPELTADVSAPPAAHR